LIGEYSRSQSYIALKLYSKSILQIQTYDKIRSLDFLGCSAMDATKLARKLLITLAKPRKSDITFAHWRATPFLNLTE
jgi:hypothetical protein